MAEYSLRLLNQTPRTWTFVVFLTLPGGDGLDSVAWRLRPVASSGQGSLAWADDLCVAIGTREATDGIVVYSDTQAKRAAVDERWKITVDAGAQQLVADGTSLTPGTVQVINEAGALANAALGVADTGAVWNGELYSDASARFRLPPSYYVLLADAMTPGEVITTGGVTWIDAATAATTIVGPRPLALSPASPALTVTARLLGETIALEVTVG